MRTLVLGIPLPHSTFDNYSFLSAPSLSEYQRLVVEMGASARAVQDVVDSTGVHQTFGGQAIVNGAASPHAFGLAELLEMRRREGERLLAGGGTVVCFGQPQVKVAEIGEGSEWASWSWLTEPDGISYAQDLVPGFGTAGAVLTDSEHPFAPLVTAVASRAAYRVYLNEDAAGAGDAARVFARSSGGVAIGFELRAGNGRIFVLPALEKPQADRQIVAQAMMQSFERLEQATQVEQRGRM